MKRSYLVVGLCVMCWVNYAAADEDGETVGLVLAVQGTVTVQSAAMTPPVPASKSRSRAIVPAATNEPSSPT
jgi:hypothetical protein